ncbi:hypothetical protein AK830_g2448 [Neonectria ditissima]|uniref:Uncharacterized protein n=1 Tax=Neonectria ditissima TaxID=78410 RepID=A0A0P7BS25_9HYPO|nr:hypothetical protein AK830_g2448 [Neonectria ditissima]
MQLVAESEWMLDQKHAEFMSPGKSFEVIQTVSGTSVFFSIGSDNHFYACREVQAGTTGWTRIDLGSNLLRPQDGRQVAIKSFTVAQNTDSLYFDLAVVATVAGSDQLFLSSGNPNTDDGWSRNDGRLGVQRTVVPFDAVGPAWKKHTLAIDLAAGSISSSLGRRFEDRVGGIYTFGQINGRLELIFAPAFDFWDPNNPPAPARLVLPDNATSIATAINAAGNSHLFVSGQQGIFYFAPDKQKDGSSGTRVITTTLVAQATQLTAESSGGTTALYGKSPQGDLFYTTCKAGSEATPEAWSLPVPLASQIENYAFFLNKQAGNNSVFAHVTGQHVAQISQDPVTRDWASRSILLPATDVNDVIEISTFTTRLTLRDDSGACLAKTDVFLTATSPVGVYFNNAYRILLGVRRALERGCYCYNFKKTIFLL